MSKNDRRVLAVALANSRMSVKAIAAKAKMRHHSVVYTLKSLRDRKIIKPYILTNPHVLGLTDYCIFFNYIGEEKQARQKIIQTCLHSTQVAYFAELTGAYQYSVSLFCRSIFEVTEFFAKLGDLLPRSSFNTSFAVRLQFTQFLGRCAEAQTAPLLLDRVKLSSETTIDDIDRSILGSYSQNADLPLRKIADLAKVSESTVRYRLKDLESRGVIQAFAYFFDGTKVGISTYRVIFSAKALERSLKGKIFDFMKSHPRASGFVNCAGAWDYELSFELADPSELSEIIEQINDRFGPYIRDMHTLVELAVPRAHHFPHSAGLLD